jgi:hypothetical protein
MSQPNESTDAREQSANLPAQSQPADAEQKRELTQEDLHRLYIEQQRRMLCPGCGEGFEVF